MSSVIQDDSSGINAGIIVRRLTVLKCTARRSGVHFNCFAAVLCNGTSARRCDRAAARSSACRRSHRVFANATTYPRCEAPFAWPLPARSPSPRQGTLLGRSGWRDDLTTLSPRDSASSPLRSFAPSLLGPFPFGPSPLRCFATSPRSNLVQKTKGVTRAVIKSQRPLANKTRAARSIAIRPRDGTLFRSNVAKMPPLTGPRSARWVRN